MGERERFRVAIAGGGITGVEALLALRALAEERVHVTLVNPGTTFTYKPLVVEEPFSHTPAERWELPPLVEEQGAAFRPGALVRVDVAGRRAQIGEGEWLDYDALVVCVGAKPRVALARAVTLRTSGEPLDIDSLLRQAAEHPSRRIAFVVPAPGSWPLPVYELALMGARRARELELDAVPTVVTPEEAPLAVFGSAPSEAVAEMLRARGIEARCGAWVREGADGRLRLMPGDELLDCGAVVALPLLQGPGVPGLPADERGFIPIDEHARVRGAEGVYAAGDGTSFPVKHGGLGTQQADAAAEHIAASAGAPIEPQPFRPVIRGRLITGEESLSLEGHPGGGGGEGDAALDPLWWPPHKVAGKYLSALIGHADPHELSEAPGHGIDVEVALPKEWHAEPMALDPLFRPQRAD